MEIFAGCSKIFVKVVPIILCGNHSGEGLNDLHSFAYQILGLFAILSYLLEEWDGMGESFSDRALGDAPLYTVSP